MEQHADFSISAIRQTRKSNEPFFYVFILFIKTFSPRYGRNMHSAHKLDGLTISPLYETSKKIPDYILSSK